MLILLYFMVAMLLAAAVCSVLSWVLYVPLVVRAFGETPWLVARSYPAQDGSEDCEFLTADNLVLRGSYLPASAPCRLGVIAFCHEFGGNRWGAVPYVADLRQRGFDIFTFDFRNHGQSDSLPGYRPMPWLSEYELADIRAAIDYLASRPDADSRGIGVLGVSRGANAAICAAAVDRRIRALVTDGAFPTLAMQQYYIRRFMRIYIRVPLLAEKLPDWCLVSFCDWARFLVGLRRNCRFVNVEQMARVVASPTFMIHGERDAYVPAEVARTLRACLAGRSKFWLIPGVRHNEAIIAATGVYHRRIARFFLKTLNGSVNGHLTPVAHRLGDDHPFSDQSPAREVMAEKGQVA